MQPRPVGKWVSKRVQAKKRQSQYQQAGRESRSRAVAYARHGGGAPPAMNLRTGGLLGLEYKYVDQAATFAFSDSWINGELDPAAGVNCIGPCVQGSGESQRDGLRIVVKSIHITGYIGRLLTVGGLARSANSIQVALVMDSQTNGVQLNAEDVYSATDPEVPGHRVIANTSRFKILWQRCFEMIDTCSMQTAAGVANMSGNIKILDVYKKLNQPVEFVAGAGAGTIADFKKVSFHLIGAASLAAPADMIFFKARTRFVG